MESPTPHKPRQIARKTGERLVPTRDRLVVRKRAERASARARIARRTRQPITAAQIAFDPLSRRSHRRGRRTAAFWAAVLGSLIIHIVAVGTGFLMRARQGASTAREDVKIEVRQRPPEPPPEKKEPPAPIEKPVRTPPKVVKAPPPSAPPPPPTKAPPVRVVGLSLESTTEGGSGPSFAVGNTRFGETDKKAVAPKDVSAAPGLDPNATEARGPGKSNQAASRIPVAGVKYEMPKRLHERKPDYPPLLKTQGIEGDVTVLVSVDATGKVTAVRIIKPSEYPEMNENARRCALTEEFTPATRDGLAIPYSLSFTYRFRLEEQ